MKGLTGTGLIGTDLLCIEHTMSRQRMAMFNRDGPYCSIPYDIYPTQKGPQSFNSSNSVYSSSLELNRDGPYFFSDSRSLPPRRGGFCVGAWGVQRTPIASACVEARCAVHTLRKFGCSAALAWGTDSGYTACVGDARPEWFSSRTVNIIFSPWRYQ